MPAATERLAYTATLSATGGTDPYNWSIASGTLLSGLSLDSSTGVVSGTPTAATGAGGEPLGIQVTDAARDGANASLSLVVQQSSGSLLHQRHQSEQP